MAPLLYLCIHRSNARAGAVAIMHEARRKGWAPEEVRSIRVLVLDLLGLVVCFWSVGLWTYARMHGYIQALAAAKEKGLSFLKSAAQTDWVVAQLYKCVWGGGGTGQLALSLCVLLRVSAGRMCLGNDRRRFMSIGLLFHYHSLVL